MALFDKASLVMIPSQYKEGKIYNIKPEDQSSSFEFERGSAATRVNSDGLIEYVGVGEELVTNGDFSDDSSFPSNGWTISLGSPVISNGKLTLPNNARVRQIDVVETTEEYVASIEISGLTQGYVDFYIGNTEKVSLDSNGTHSFFVSDPTSAVIYLYAFNNFDGEIDNVSVKQVSNDTPRLDYSGTEPSLLLEPQRTNLVTESNDFSSWTTANSTVTQSNISLPTNSNSWSLVDDDNQGYHQVYKTITPSASLDYSLSVFVKPINATECTLAFGGGGYGGNRSVFYSLVGDGSITTQQANIDNSSITKIGEWYKITLSTNIGSGSGTTFMQLMPTVNGQQAYTGSGQEMMLFGDIQLEQGSYATSYIPTNGQAETRLADVCQGGGDASVFNDSEGVLYAEVKFNSATYNHLSLNDGTSNNNVVIWSHSGDVIRTNVTASGSYTLNFTTSVNSINSFNKVAIKYKQNDFSVFINGQEIHTDTSGNVPTGLNQLSFDNGSGGTTIFEGSVKSLHYFPEELTDTELQQLTTI